MLLLFFTLVWLSIWSFVNAMIWRAKHDENFITSRSICTSCNKILLAIDLIPIFSYLNLRWKCRFCKEDIWLKYIVVEILYWILFYSSSFFFSLLNFQLRSGRFFNFSFCIQCTALNFYIWYNLFRNIWPTYNIIYICYFIFGFSLNMIYTNTICL